MRAKKYLILVATLVICGAIVWAAKTQSTDSKSSTENLPSPLVSKIEAAAKKALAETDFLTYSIDASQITWASQAQTLAGLKDVGLVVAIDIKRPVEVEKYGLTRKLLQTQTEQQLRKHGIKILTLNELRKSPESPVVSLYINVNAQVLKGHTVAPVNTNVRLLQVVSLARTLGTFCLATTWQKDAIQFGDIQALKEIRITVSSLVDEFINDYLAANPKNEQMITGTVQYLDFEGGFYGLVADSGEKYDPINLPKEYKKDGLRVKFQVEEKKGMVGFHMWGKIVEVVKIERN